MYIAKNQLSLIIYWKFFFILYRLYKDGEKMSDEIGVFFNLFFLCTDSQQCTCKKKHWCLLV